MAFTKSKLEYWNGSAWTQATTPNSQNAMLDFTLTEKMGQPSMLEVRIANRMTNAFSATSSKYKGNLTGVFTDFIRVRIVDTSTYVILFYGRVYKVSEQHDMAYGNVINLVCFDALEELKDNVTDGATDIIIDTSVSDTYPTLASPSTAVDRRSGVIKGLISFFSKSGNIDITDDTNRFTPSIREFVTTQMLSNSNSKTKYLLKESNNKSVLAHIIGLAKDETHTTDANRFGTTGGFDFYVDPNFTSTGAQTPAAYFNYFKRGTRPYTSAASNGLRIEYPTGGGLTKTGRIFPMMSDYDFNKPQLEMFTDVAVHYMDSGNHEHNGSTNYGKGFGNQERTVKMELIKIKEIENGNTFKWLELGFGTSDADSTGATDGTDVSEWLSVSGIAKAARIQYISAASSGSDAYPEYALISHIHPSFPTAAGTEVTGATSGSGVNFHLVSRPSTDAGVIRTARLGAVNTDNVDAVREEAVLRLRRSTDTIIRGRVRIINKPYFNVESDSTTMGVDSGTTTVTFGGGFNPLNYGFRKGMTVAKVNSSGVVQSYGYASAVTSTTVAATMTASLTNGDTIRLFVPVRASDVVYIVNNLVNITGSDFLVTDLVYTESNGILNTEFTVVGTESGLGPPQNIVAAAASAMQEQNRLDVLGSNYKHIRSRFTGVFSAGVDGDATDQPHNNISWTAGQLTVGPDSYDIIAGSATASAGDLVSYKYVWFHPDSSTTAVSGGHYANANQTHKDSVVLAYWRAVADGSNIEINVLTVP
tara:strand:- start:9308 stop:11587 length:2280 start_codon:yes stop_codon:yes gene_type:complete